MNISDPPATKKDPMRAKRSGPPVEDHAIAPSRGRPRKKVHPDHSVSSVIPSVVSSNRAPSRSRAAATSSDRPSRGFRVTELPLDGITLDTGN